MFKHLHYFKSWLLLMLCMVVGVGSASAEEVTIASFSHASNDGWTINNAEYATAGGGYYKLISSDASIVTPNINWSQYSDITITISARKFGGPDATQGKISVSQGTTELASYSPSGTSIVASSALAISPSSGAITISCPGASSSKGCGVQSIVIKGTEASTPSAPLNHITLSGSYPTSFKQGAEFSHEGMTVTATYEDNTTKDVTTSATFTGYDMSTAGNQTVTVSYTEGEVTETATYDITVNSVPSHTVTWSVNGTTTSEQVKEGFAITFPANPEDIGEKTFVGWTENSISGTTDTAPTLVTSATMGNADMTFYAVFATASGGATTVTDELTRATTGVTSGSTNYEDWSGKTSNSNAVYAGNSAGGNDAIQLRTNKSTAGVVTTASGGTLKKITIEWNSNTSAGRKVDIYANDAAYSAASDLYNSSTQGTKIGTLAYDTETELSVPDGYTYFGLRSNDGALYLDKISVQWQAGSASYSGYCTTVEADTRQNPELTFSETEVEGSIGQDFTAPTLSAATGFNGTVEYESSDESVAQIMDQETGEIRLVGEGTATITATFAGNDDFKAGSASYTLTVTDNRIETTITNDNISLGLTEVATLTRLAPVVKDANDNVVAYTYGEWPTEVSFEIVSDENSIISYLDNNSGEITLNSVEGTATLKACYNYFNVNSTYKPSECTFTITVTDPNKKGGLNNPYTVAEAIAAIDEGGDITNVYVTGIVCTGGSSLSNGAMNYYISDDGTETERLEIFRGLGINGSDFESTDDIQVDDEVIVYGNLTKYSSIYEFAAGSNLVSRVRPLTADLTFDQESYSVNIGEALTITASATNSDGAITYESSNTNVAEIDANGVVTAKSAGTTIIKATIAATADVRGTSVTAELTVIDPNAPTETWVLVDPTDLQTGDIVVIVDQTTANAMANDGGTKDAPTAPTVTLKKDKSEITSAVDATIQWVVTIDEDETRTYQFGVQGTDNYLYCTNTNNGVRVGTNSNNVFTLEAHTNNVLFLQNEATSRFVGHNTQNDNNDWRCYTSVNSNINACVTAFYKKVATLPVTITSAGAASFSSKYALDFSKVEGLKAYKATSKSDSYVHLDEVEQVPAGAGVIVKTSEELTEDKTYQVPVATGDVAELTGNLLVGTVNSTFTVEHADYGKVFKYVKRTSDNVVGFQKAKEGWTCQAGHAYLMYSEPQAREFIGIFDEDIATGINSIDNSQLTIDNDAPAYNLAGQKVGKGYKGIVVKNGKKVVIK